MVPMRITAAPHSIFGAQAGRRRPAHNTGLGPKFRWIGEHLLNSRVFQLLGVPASVLGQGQNDFGKLQAGRFYGPGALADQQRDLLPGIFEGLGDDL